MNGQHTLLHGWQLISLGFSFIVGVLFPQKITSHVASPVACTNFGHSPPWHSFANCRDQTWKNTSSGLDIWAQVSQDSPLHRLWSFAVLPTSFIMFYQFLFPVPRFWTVKTMAKDYVPLSLRYHLRITTLIRFNFNHVEEHDKVRIIPFWGWARINTQHEYELYVYINIQIHIISSIFQFECFNRAIANIWLQHVATTQPTNQ